MYFIASANHVSLSYPTYPFMELYHVFLSMSRKRTLQYGALILVWEMASICFIVLAPAVGDGPSREALLEHEACDPGHPSSGGF